MIDPTGRSSTATVESTREALFPIGERAGLPASFAEPVVLRESPIRGNAESLRLPVAGRTAPRIDVLHWILRLIEHRPVEVAGLPRAAHTNLDPTPLTPPSFATLALEGGSLGTLSSSAEAGAYVVLTANWRSVLGERTPTSREREDAKTRKRALEARRGRPR